MVKSRLLVPVPGSTRNGTPGIWNEGSFTPRSRALAESTVRLVTWLMTALTSMDPNAEPAARRLALITVGPAIQRWGGSHTTNRGSVGAPNGTRPCYGEIQRSLLQQKPRKILLPGKFDRVSGSAQAFRTGSRPREQSRRHVLLRQLGPIERLLEAIDAHLAEERAPDVRCVERRQLQQ